jgi:hypothetical protein
MMFNGNLDCCAWGGSRYATLDGLSKVWRVTWEPPWGWGDMGVIAHEMGHGFGLPHANNFDGDSSPYDSPWDVMSSATGYAINDATYGRLGKHINAYHKEQLDWISGATLLEVPAGNEVTATIDAMADLTTTNYRMAKIPIPGGNRYYTVEARKRFGSYDGALPGDVVIIHHVQPGRAQPSWAVDTDVPPADYGDNEGTMFRVGEVFTDSANNISVSIDSETIDGFVVTIDTRDQLPDGVFISDFEAL